LLSRSLGLGHKQQIAQYSRSQHVEDHAGLACSRSMHLVRAGEHREKIDGGMGAERSPTSCAAKNAPSWLNPP